jgi:hypothetical protein
VKLHLASVGNPDFGQAPGPLPGVPNHTVTVKDYAEASRVSREWIIANELGGGNWNGGTITDDSGKEIAYVSYNGRVWPPGKWTPNTEPLYEPEM